MNKFPWVIEPILYDGKTFWQFYSHLASIMILSPFLWMAGDQQMNVIPIRQTSNIGLVYIQISANFRRFAIIWNVEGVNLVIIFPTDSRVAYKTGLCAIVLNVIAHEPGDGHGYGICTILTAFFFGAGNHSKRYEGKYPCSPYNCSQFFSLSFLFVFSIIVRCLFLICHCAQRISMIQADST